MKKIFLTSLIFFSLSSFAQEYLAPDFSSPRSTMNYFLKTMKLYKKGDSNALILASRVFDLSKIDQDIREDVAKASAVKLINTLDRLERIDVTEIPQNLKENNWVYKSESFLQNGTYEKATISLVRTKEKLWLFSHETVKTISLFENSLADKPIVDGVIELKTWRDEIKSLSPAWMGHKSFILLNGQWVALLLLIFVAFVLEKILKLVLFRLLKKVLEKRSLSLKEETEKRLSFPLGLIGIALFWSIGIRFLEIEITVLSWLARAGKVLLTFGVVFLTYQMVGVLGLILHKKAQETENKFDDILVPLVEKSLKTFVIAIGVIAIGDSLTLDMKGLLAGLGIVGLGVSLAAKDTISNLFGSLTVLLDRPFRIGDWIVIDNKVEGVVEEVGLRSCRIRTFYNSLITIPNGMLTNAHIDNYGMRKYRRLSTYVSVQYDTPPELIEAYCEGIRQIIGNHPKTRKDSFHVYLNKMSASSLDIILYVFWQVNDWSEELQERHRLLMDIIRLAKEMKIEFAFPTQTLHLFNEEKSIESNDLEVKEIQELAKDLSIKISNDSITPTEARSSLTSLK